MGNYSKNSFFWDEILEIIPCGVSLRTFSAKSKQEDRSSLKNPESRSFSKKKHSQDKQQ